MLNKLLQAFVVYLLLMGTVNVAGFAIEFPYSITAEIVASLICGVGAVAIVEIVTK